MPPLPIDASSLIVAIVGAVLAGFVTGFAGFGTGLVASGLWFYALPPIMVPPLVALASVAGQLVGLVTVRKAFAWSQAAPYMIGGVLGLPLGILALGAASPDVLRTCVGVFLVGYAGFQLLRRGGLSVGDWGGRWLDGIVGIGGGFLGGFAGLSGPLPLIWLQLRGGDSTAHRAIYQPFNLVVLALASLGMAAHGIITEQLIWIALWCLPATVLGAWLGTRVYIGVSLATFQRIVLALLAVSGIILLLQAVLHK
jgi:uncharacterized membrane protein YfcA